MSEIINEEMTINAENTAEEMPADVQRDCTLNKYAQSKERLFTQDRLEEILRERLGRERKTNEDLSQVKSLLKAVAEKGLIEGSSYSEMAKSLIEKLGTHTGAYEQKHSDAADMPESEKNTPVIADMGGTSILEDSVGNTESEDGTRESFIKTLSDIKAKYPTADTLLSGDRFQKFAKGRSGSIGEIFDDYYDFVTSLEGAEKGGDNRDGSHAALASTAFSAESGVSDEGASLTKQQMEIAKSAGMSYREYSRLLESIPQRAARRN